MNLATSVDTSWGDQIAPAPIDSDAPIWSAEFLESALAGSRIGTWQVDMETGLVTWDAETSKMLGLPPLALTTHALLPVHEEDRASVQEHLEESHRSGRPYDKIFRGVPSTGEIRWFHGRGQAHPIGSAYPRYMAGTVVDITDRKKIEEACAESERQLRSVVENLPGVVYRCELKAPWRMQFISDAAFEITGYAATEFISGRMSWEQIIAPEDRGSLTALVAEAVNGRTKYEVCYRILHASGETRWVEERGAAVYAEDGRPIFLEGFIGDAHERTVAGRKLRETEERFRRAAQATQDTIWDWDLIADQVTWDASVGETLGFSSDKLGTDPNWWLDRVHPDDRGRVETSIEDAVSGRSKRFEADYRFLKADGSYADIFDRGYVIEDERGSPIRLVGAMHDNTARNASTRALQAREARLHTVFEQALVGIMEVRADGRVLMVNSRFCEILGRTPEQLEKSTLRDYTHPDEVSQNLSLLETHIKSGKPFQIEKRYIRPNGEIVWCNVSVSFVLSTGDAIESLIIVAEDISAKKAAKDALRASEMLYQSVVEATADCVQIVRLDGTLRFINPPGLQRLELDNADEVIGRQWPELWPEQSRNVIEAALDGARAGESIRCTGFFPTAKGTPKWWDVSVTPIWAEGGEVHEVLAILRDNTLQRTTAESLRWASEHDTLTELPNRRSFEARLQAATIRAMQKGSEVGLLLLDLDHFKHVNDTLGHAAGDHLLKVFGKRLKESIRSGDFVARLGGDEFAVILEGSEEAPDPLKSGEAILNRLHKPINYDGRMISAGASIGGALFPRDAPTANELFNNADTALYALKGSGRGGTRMFHQHMREQAQIESSQLNLARSAITEKSVEPHYQQKIDLKTGRIAGFEALLRWRHPTRGIQPPETVAEAFKDYELATRIGDFMQRRVFTDMRGWLKKGLPIGFVAINAAPVEFLRDDFAERLLARMEDQQIPPHLVEIEVTEHVFLERGSDFVGRALKVLSRAGVRIALDDFGTGSSSLSHLRDYPVDVVKIDRSFIETLPTDPEIRAIVSAVIDLAASLNIEVVAEGVENQAQKRLLIKHGCRMGQGFLFGRAIDADEVPGLLGPVTEPSRIAV